MKKTALLTAVTVVTQLTLALEARAGGYFKDGNALHSECSEEGSSFQDGLCLGFIIGVLDGNNAKGFYPYCDPDNSKAGQLRDVVKKWLEDNPQFRASPAGDLVNAAMMEAFPPALRWRTNFRQDDDGEWINSAFHFRETEDEGKWVAFCDEETYTDGAEVWGWSITLPTTLYERLDTIKYLSGED